AIAACRRHRHPRSCCRTAVIPPDHGDEGWCGDRIGAYRPGARRSSRTVYAVACVFDPSCLRCQMYVLDLVNVKKSFILHLQDGLRLPVISGVNFAVQPGECLALVGPSGCGKSSILKMIFGSYRCDGGHILIRDNERIVDIATASPRTVITTRGRAVAYVSQF